MDVHVSGGGTAVGVRCTLLLQAEMTPFVILFRPFGVVTFCCRCCLFIVYFLFLLRTNVH